MTGTGTSPPLLSFACYCFLNACVYLREAEHPMLASPLAP